MQSIHIKVALIGDKQTGKTRFTRLVNNIGRTNYKPTLGVDVYSKYVKHNGIKYVLNFWDCAGDSRYLGLGSEYIKDSDYVLLFGQDFSFKDWIPNNTPFKTISNPDNIDLKEILLELTTKIENFTI